MSQETWRSFSQSHNLTPNLHLAREPLTLCSTKAPVLPLLLTPSHSIYPPHALIKIPLPSQYHRYLLSILPISRDITAWTDGSVSGGLGQGGAGIHIKCTKCVTATSLSFSTGLWATSYSAETYAILHALGWCISSKPPPCIRLWSI